MSWIEQQESMKTWTICHFKLISWCLLPTPHRLFFLFGTSKLLQVKSWKGYLHLLLDLWIGMLMRAFLFWKHMDCWFIISMKKPIFDLGFYYWSSYIISFCPFGCIIEIPMFEPVEKKMHIKTQCKYVLRTSTSVGKWQNRDDPNIL